MNDTWLETYNELCNAVRYGRCTEEEYHIAMMKLLFPQMGTILQEEFIERMKIEKEFEEGVLYL